MKEKFQSNLKHLLDNAERVLLAVSGGVDSMVMAELFLNSKVEFGIAHCNFSLRGKESDADESFIENWCSNHNIPFFVKKFETTEIGKETKKGIQETARNLRYIFFKNICNEKHYNLIATAHHRDDSIETVLFNLSRGTGLNGITGIKDKQGKIIRPLLPFSKKEILFFAESNQIKFREDSSNRSTKYRRNFIRHKVIPILKTLNPNFETNVTNTIKRLEATNEIFKFYIEKIKDEVITKNGKTVVISKNKLKNLTQPQTILFELIREFGFNFTQAEDIFTTIDSQSGAVFHAHPYQLLNDRTSLIITSKKSDQKLYFELKPNSNIVLPQGKIICSDKISVKEFKKNLDLNIALLDAEKLQFPLVIEKWKSGDRFHPFGMEGKSKKISDFLINQKINRFQKDHILLLKSAGQICWVIGQRIDENFKITNKSTHFYRFKFSV